MTTYLERYCRYPALNTCMNPPSDGSYYCQNHRCNSQWGGRRCPFEIKSPEDSFCHRHTYWKLFNHFYQQLFERYYNESRSQWRMGGSYNRDAAALVSQAIGRRIIENNDALYHHFLEFWPKNTDEYRRAKHRLNHLIGGSFEPYYYHQDFIVYRDLLLAFRDIKRPTCAVCGTRYRRKIHWEMRKDYDHIWVGSNASLELWNNWSSVQWIPAIPKLHVLGHYLYVHACSDNCRAKARKRRIKEIKWLKLAQQRYKELRQTLRNLPARNHAVLP